MGASDSRKSLNERNKREGKLDSIETIAWTDRRFPVDLPKGLFPSVLERLRGTSGRSCDLVCGPQEKFRPRLQRSLRVLDWAYFIVGHDDHRLAQARRVLGATVQRTSLQAEGT